MHKHEFTRVYVHTSYIYHTHRYTHTIHIHTATPTNTHARAHTHTHTSTKLYITHIKSYKAHNLTNCLHDLVYILNMKRKNNKQ